MPSPAASRRATLAVGGVLLLLLSACSVPGFGPRAETAAAGLARALEAGDLTEVDFVDGAEPAEELTALIGGMRDRLPDATITVGEVATEGSSATATLAWRWELERATWTYQTEVALTRGETSAGDRWLVRWSPEIVEPSLEPGDRLAVQAVAAQRGAILGAGDEPIVTLRPVLRVGIDKTALEPGRATRSATALAEVVGVDAKSYAAQVTAGGPRAFVSAIVYRSREVPAGVLAGVRAVPGGAVIKDRLPLAPTKEFAAAILGTVGPATAELVKASKGRIEPGDEVGLSGLQKRYDEQLAGSRGARVVALEESGRERTLFTADAVPGKALRTTLDVAAQRVAQRVLADVGPASALVALRPSTGELVAVASGPGSKGYNTATLGQYAPGSTFKVVSALALLRAGATPGSQVPCPATLVVDGKRFKNYDDYPASGLGRISLADALANSCNTAFISQRTELDPKALAEAGAALGLGVDADTGFPSFFGTIGAPASETQAAASMIGQGKVLASPMAMATVVASVLEGSAVTPRLLPGVEVEQQAPRAPLTRAEADQVTTMMRGVVERGSGRLLGDLPGGPVIAKTGTAEFGTSPPLPTHAWMVAGRDDLAVAVFVERGDSGSGTAGPVLRRYLASPAADGAG